MGRKEHKRVMAAQVTGSVGVRHAAMQSAEITSKSGNKKCTTATVRSTKVSTRDVCHEKTLSRNDHPAESHSRHDHDEQAFCMLLHVSTREFDANREQARGKHNTHYLEGNCVLLGSPSSGIKHICHVRTNYHSESGSKYNFVDVQLRDGFSGYDNGYWDDEPFPSQEGTPWRTT
jgi:hypothetical protein